MGKFDLSKAEDFARATNSFGAGLVGQFTARNSSEWLIDEGKYKSGVTPANEVIFHVFVSSLDYGGAVQQIADSGGRRKAKYEFPFQDGQLTNDMGREPETFTIEVVLHGNNYLDAFNRLMNILNEPTPGILTHPVRGDIPCAMEHYEITHQESMRKAVSIRLTMTEHSIEALQLATAPDKTAPSLLSKLTASFTKIENAINAVQGAQFFVQSLKIQITSGLQDFQNAYAKVAGNMNATFNPGGNIPALLPVQGGGLQDNSGAIVSNSVTNVLAPSDPFANAPANLIQTSLQQALQIDNIQKTIEQTRAMVAQSIEDMEAAGNGQGALEFFSEIIGLRETVNDMQAAFEAGKQSSQVRIINYMTPRLMSVREVAYANGVKPDDSDQVAFLNPELESLNYIPQGTAVKVAVT